MNWLEFIMWMVVLAATVVVLAFISIVIYSTIKVVRPEKREFPKAVPVLEDRLEEATEQDLIRGANIVHNVGFFSTHETSRQFYEALRERGYDIVRVD